MIRILLASLTEAQTDEVVKLLRTFGSCAVGHFDGNNDRDGRPLELVQAAREMDENMGARTVIDILYPERVKLEYSGSYVEGVAFRK